MEEKSNLNKVKENDIYVRLQFLRTNGQPDGKSAGRSGHQHGTCAVCYSTIRVDAADQTGGIHLVLYPDRAWSILNSAFSIALWGEDRSRGGSNNYYGNNRGQRNSYDGYYQGSQNNRPNPPPVRRSLQNLDFESRGDAEDTLAGLRDALYRYRQVSVGDLWDLMGVTNDSTDYNYGWYNLDDAFIKGIPGGFRLVLPHTVPLR